MGADRARRPLILLGLLSITSLALRCFRLGDPNGLVYDESFYVPAARNILGIAIRNSPFPPAAPGLDPNIAHPPLGKLLIAGGIRLLGDNGYGWRAPSVVFGSIAILLMYWLVRTGGGGRWPALSAAALMAVDNLFFVHGRIATLDIFVVVFMLGAVGLYMSNRWVMAGIALGVGACTKLVAGDIVLVLLLFEGGRLLVQRRSGGGLPDRSPRAALRAAAGLIAVSAVTYLGLLAILDVYVSSYQDPVQHTQAILKFLSNETVNVPSPGRLVTPLSAPWEWLIDRASIIYWRDPGIGPERIYFQGVASPLIAFASVPALVLAARAVWVEHDRLAVLALAWFLGTMIPYSVGALLHRNTYLYYFVTVLPAVYIAIARCLTGIPRVPVPARAAYAMGLVINLGMLFPFKTWSG